ncbi:glycosyltransferase [Puniceibacterium sediminis]|uniref:Glycosyltransferase involved in cell wall bisynthesis n=1 Tax=Puniceibacterium sediminis TaxID=1608407 RepID=A0A238YMX9_9RHOB|nr:glycosyltransferase [Puniceibacterium sediminis]SNR72515.1 Glycosyltransferase involved in cell wall bisynthesis [Puniceibacterium sediminis]
MNAQAILPSVNLHLEEGDVLSARTMLQAAMKAHPDFFLYHERLAEIALLEGDEGTARAAYIRALALNPAATWIEERLAELDGIRVGAGLVGKYDRYPDLTGRRQAEGGARLRGILKSAQPDLPLVTIVTAVYDNKDSFQRCIDSVRAQTYANVEYIVVDGGSPQGTVDVIGANDDFIDYYISEPDRGIYSAMNKGLRLARGDYVCLLNSDDQHGPDHVKRAVEAALAQGPVGAVDIVYSDFWDGDNMLPAQPLNDGILLGNLNVNHCTFLVHRDCYDRVGPYAENLGIVSDMVWIRRAYATQERFHLLSEAHFRFTPGGASSGNSPERRRKIIFENGQCYRVEFPFLTQEEAETLYLLRFGDSRLEAAAEIGRRYGPDQPRFAAALAAYVEHCFRDRDAFALAYDQEERFTLYWRVAKELGVDRRHIRMDTANGCLSQQLAQIANMPLKPRKPGAQRILHYVTVFSAPSETFIYDLVQRLEAETEHDNIVLFQHAELRKERAYDKSLQIVWEKYRGVVARALYEYLIDTCGIDLMIAHFAINEHRLHGRVADTGITLPTIVMTHGIDVFLLKEKSPYTDYVRGKLAPRGDVCFTAVSNYLRDELIAVGIEREKVFVLPNSVNPRFFKHRKTDGFYDGARRLELLSMGRLIPWKGHHLLLRALARFRAEVSRDVRLTIVYGNCDDELANLTALAAELDLTDAVVFQPFVDFGRSPDFLSRFDLYLHPSTYTEDSARKSETFGVALLEAIAAGLPVITTDAGGLPEVLGEDSPQACIVPHGDADALFSALRDMHGAPATFTDNLPYAQDRLDAFSAAKQITGLDQLIRKMADPIKVALFSSSTLQGAGYAAYRVHRGLVALPGVAPTIFTTVRDHQSAAGVRPIAHPSTDNTRWRTLQPQAKPGNTIFTVNQTHLHSEDLLRMVEPYDVISLHWHARFLSAENIATLTHSDKPVVMTIRDMQPITGGCHFFHGCEKWQTDCADCPQIPSAYTDFPASVLAAKRAHYNFDNLTLVTISNHTRGILERAPYFRDCRIETILNSIETDVFRPYDRKARRREFGLPLDRKIIGYVPSYASEIKGYRELVAALNMLDPAQLGFDPYVMLVGNETPATAQIRQDKKALGYIADNDRLARAYSCADVVVVPSLEETFSNTTAEAISCGVPVVGFRTGAIPDLAIKGRAGYTAEMGDVAGLAQGIREVLSGHDMSKACRDHAVNTLSFMKQAHGYEALFADLLARNRSRPKAPPQVFNSFDALGFGLANMAAEMRINAK